MIDDPLPPYAAMLAARHAAHATELRAVVDSLPLPGDATVVVVAGGDGFFARSFAGRDGVRRVLSLDLSPGFLHWAGARHDDLPASTAAKIVPVRADAERLPLPDGGADLCWCAQSLMSLGGSQRVVDEMARVLRAGRLAAVLEDDRTRQLELPWPVDLDARLAAAELAAADDEHGDAGLAAVARRVPDMLREAGLRGVARRSIAVDRDRLTRGDRVFLAAHLADVLERLTDRLDRRDRNRIAAVVRSLEGPPADAAATPAWMSWHDTLVTARRPGTTHGRMRPRRVSN